VSSVSAVIVAAGKGERLGSRKQFLPLAELPLLLWSVQTFATHPAVVETVVVLPEDAVSSPPDWLVRQGLKLCPGGASRRESAGLGVAAASAAAGLILIHDAARPFVTHALIDRVINAAARSGAAVPLIPLADTIKQLQGERVTGTVDRAGLGRAQTPQGFEAALIREVHDRASRSRATASDDVALCEAAGHTVLAVEGDPHNLKITTLEDLALAEWLVGSGRITPPATGRAAGGPR
jgi:2-C-methyl-D-erythritol 4-phosphate cytidylyltransferase